MPEMNGVVVTICDQLLGALSRTVGMRDRLLPVRGTGAKGAWQQIAEPDRFDPRIAIEQDHQLTVAWDKLVQHLAAGATGGGARRARR